MPKSTLAAFYLLNVPNYIHHKIRVEAVQQALAQYGKATPSRLPVLAPVKRPSYVTSANQNNRHKNEKIIRRSKDKRLSDSSSDDDSLMNSSGDSSGRKKNNENISSSANSSKIISNQTPPHPQNKATKSSYSSPPHQQLQYHLKYTNSNLTHYFSPVSEEESNLSNNNNNQTKIMKFDQKRVSQNHNTRPPPPDVTNNANIIQYRNYNNQLVVSSNNEKRTSIQDSAKQRCYINGQRNSRASFDSPNNTSNRIPSSNAANNKSFDDSVSSGAIEFDSPNKLAESFYVNNNNGKNLSNDNLYQNTELQSDYQNAVLKPPKVSQKIQQLLNTLQRPKKKPLQEYYNDDEAELEILAKIVDPNAPKAEGAIVCPAKGEPIQLPSTLPRTLESALQIFGSANHRHLVATVLDPSGTKPPTTLTYGKLFSRATKVAYTLLTKLTNKIDPPLKTGDRVALVYPNNDPISFIIAFYGCQFAGLVPVPLDVPLTKRDAGIQQLGFLLGSCQIRVALTSEACLKGLPKSNTVSQTDVVDLKGWPPLAWVIAEHLPRPPKDWLPPARLTDETVAFIEYTTGKEGSVKGVCISKAAMLAHCRALTAACDYQEGDSMVCVLDFKREVGFWHSVVANVYNGMHCIFIPYALMKVNPSSWMHMITKHKASVALAKSRDLHWGLLAGRDQKEINLGSLRMLIVADGSLSSCDQFVNIFQSRGLRPDVLCPCAYSPETLTVSIRRPGRNGVGNAGRGVLSMSALSYGVVRVDQETSLTSLTLQDAGQVVPGATAAVVKLIGPPKLCKADEIGEICLYGPSLANGYWGLEGLSLSIFKLEPLGADDRPLGAVQFVRSGFIGFMGPGGLIFICGTKNGLMNVSGRQHNADDIIATVLAVEPMKFVYRGRIVVFSINVLRDERICIIAEQKADATEEECFQWMSRVLQAIDSIHQVGVYCLALVLPNHLPKGWVSHAGIK
uniref:AMP-dependent synthetase/ligase domain-containing protein n=1 Tax=Romanomermis culicivorax TaxID=13658 RepID=A0A915KHN5_ROMCU